MATFFDEAAKATAQGGEQGRKEVLDFLATEVALGVTFVTAARAELEELGIGYGVRGDRPGRSYEYPGEPASGVGTPVSHPTPA